jgi:branched-chain amino acid transport system ATP-binding protein
MAAILEAIGVTRHFGAVRAADNLTVSLRAGEVVGIVGPNGSGKTTFVNIATGYVKPTTGQLRFLGRDVLRLDPRRMTELGVTRSFQIPQLYNRLSLEENMLLALAIRDGAAFDFWRPLKSSERVEAARKILAAFGLSSDPSAAVSTLPGGGRKVLDVALAYSRHPTLLFLDEPTSGVSADEKMHVMDTLMGVLRASDITTVFIEHDMDIVSRYAERVLVFSEGSIMADDTPERVFADPAVRAHVLGEGV